jgi:ECF transporter S component (folate family)
MKTRQLTMDAMLAAVCAVLANFALTFGNSMKFTFESLPIHVGALLFGPVDGVAIGCVGTLIYQMLRYGVTVTTVLWMLPYMACGLLVGWYAQQKRFVLNRRQTIFLVVLGELVVTLLNTGAIYVDSHIYGYYTPTLITGVLGIRLVICVGKAVAYGLLLPSVLDGVRRGLHLPQGGEVKKAGV